MKKILVIAPHADDEVLGLGGYLLHEFKNGSSIIIVYAAIGGKNVRQETNVRLEEVDSVCGALDARYTCLYLNKDAELDTVPSCDIVSKIDDIVDEYKPDEVFINCTSHHQDHKKLYECAMASMRQREGFVPKMVALYEYPCLEPGERIDGGRWYHVIDDVIEEKCGLMEMYKSQIRKEPSPINSKGIMSLAAIRGRECGSAYAELFYVQKMKS